MHYYVLSSSDFILCMKICTGRGGTTGFVIGQSVQLANRRLSCATLSRYNDDTLLYLSLLFQTSSNFIGT